jgi:hypothetical protein
MYLEKIKKLREQQWLVQVELAQEEDTIKAIHKKYGITDLQERAYPHPVTMRLTRLLEEQDNCVLEISQLDHKIEFTKQASDSEDAESQELKKAKADMFLVSGKLLKLRRLVEEAKVEKRNLDLARTSYQKQVRIRDEKREKLNSIKSKIELLEEKYEEYGKSYSEKEPKFTTAKRHSTTLVIEVSEEGLDGEKEVSLTIPLEGLDITNTVIPEQAQKQMDAYGITLEGIIKKVENGLKPTELLYVIEENCRVIIRLE